MVKKLAEKDNHPFEWIDVVDPDQEEIQRIAKEYDLHESSVNDCLQPDHLPKYEKIDDYVFIIFRMHAPEEKGEADTVRELTDKIALFLSKDRLITIHRKDWFPLDDICDRNIKAKLCKTPFHLLTEIIRTGLLTFDEPALKLTQAINYFEENIFLRRRKISLLKKLYFIKRKIDVIRRILILTHDLVDHIDSPQTNTAYTRDMRDTYIRMSNIYDSLAENTNQLFNLYFSISAQKTNEIIRVLTLFSVFFMPLTFIAGIYGMNFDFMPELRWRLGYPGVILTMAVITALIYWWFRRKGWL
jgi:magnesium transporter